MKKFGVRNFGSWRGVGREGFGGGVLVVGNLKKIRGFLGAVLKRW